MVMRIVLTALLPLLLQASWVEDFRQGRFTPESGSYYALTTESVTDTADVRKLAIERGVQDLSRQLHAAVLSRAAEAEHNGSAQLEHALLVTAVMPVLTQRILEETTQGEALHLLTVLSQRDALPAYRNRAETLAQQVGDAMHDAEAAHSKTLKRYYLRQAQKALANYHRYVAVADVLGSGAISSPTFGAQVIDEAVAALERMPALSEQELARLLVRRLGVRSLEGSVTVAPVGDAASDAFTPFSVRIQKALAAALRRKKVVVTRGDADFTVVGSFFPHPEGLRVQLRAIDRYGEVVGAAAATLRTDDPPRAAATDRTAEATLFDPALTIQAAVNGHNPALLPEAEGSVEVRIRVSREAYIYVIADRRSADGKQVLHLLPRGDVADAFERNVSAEAAGTWVPLDLSHLQGSGVRTLRIFATDQPIRDTLPRHAVRTLGTGRIPGVLVDWKGEMLDGWQAVRKMHDICKKRQWQADFHMSEALLRLSFLPEKGSD